MSKFKNTFVTDGYDFSLINGIQVFFSLKVVNEYDNTITPRHDLQLFVVLGL